MPIVGSGHSLLVLQLCFQDKKGRMPFKFEMIWTTEHECAEVVKEGWRSEVKGSLLLRW